MTIFARNVARVAIIYLTASAFAASPERRTVQVVVTDGFGNVLPHSAAVLFYGDGAAQKASLTFPAERTLSLPSGGYTYIVSSQGFKTSWGRFYVDGDHSHLSVCLEIGSVDGSQGSHRASVDGHVDIEEPVEWFKLTGVFCDCIRSGPVTRGRFSLRNLNPGVYHLVLVGKEKVHHHQLVELILGNNDLRILSKPRP
jgi:hypothetical protein